MLAPTIFTTAIVACLALTGQALETRAYHNGPHHARKYAASRRMSSPNSVNSKHGATSHARFSSEGIWGPGFTDQQLATSYEDAEYGGNLGGACGWNLGPNGHEYPKMVINGAAQKLSYFGEGLACGTCVKLTPTKNSDAYHKNPDPLTVTVVNSCPGTCHSLDVEADSVRAHFGTRLGQWDVSAEVVPCKFLENGITIQYRQISHTIYDLRLGIRFQAGAVLKLQAKQSCSDKWIDMHQGESDQFTPVEGGGVSQMVLDTSIFKSASGGAQSKLSGGNGGGSENTIDLKITSFTGEVIYAWKVPQPMNKPEYWFDSKVNFKEY